MQAKFASSEIMQNIQKVELDAVSKWATHTETFCRTNCSSQYGYVKRKCNA